MRLLLTTYHQAFLVPGGGETELRQLAELMVDQGVRADLYGPQSRRLSFYDAVVHFSAHGGGEILLDEIAAHDKPIVLVPNYNFFDGDRSSHQIIQRHLDLADLVVFRTNAEREICLKDFSLERERTCIVPAGISPAFAVPAEPDLFRSAYGIDRFVLWVGQIHPGKGQLAAIEAMSDLDLDLDLVFVGGYSDRPYYDQCKKSAGDRVRFLPFMQPNSEILRSAMQTCSAYLELGNDPPGFSAIEAALAGASLVLRDHPWSREVLGDAVTYVLNDGREAIKSAVRIAASSPRSVTSSIALGRRHIQPAPTTELLQEIEKLLAQAGKRGGQANEKSSLL